MRQHFKGYSAAIKDVFYLVALQGISYIIPLLVWPYLMVVLGAEAFGILSFAVSFCQFLVLVVDYGFNITATKRVALAETREQLSRIVADTMYAKLLLLLLSALVVVFFAMIPKFAPYRTAVFILFGMVLGSTFTLQWLYQGLKKIRIVSFVVTICRLLVLPLTFLLVKSPAHLLLAVGIQSVTYVLSGAIMMIITFRCRIVDYYRFSWRAVKAALQESLPIFVSSAMSSVYAILFVVILGYCVSPDEVGRYSAAEKVMRVGCYTILMPILQAFYPRISQMAQRDKAAASRVVRRIVCVVEVLMFAFGLVLFFASDHLMVLLGKDYAGTDVLFKIMAFIPMFISLGGIEGQLGLMAIGREGDKVLFRNVYVAAAIFALVSIAACSPILSVPVAAGVLFVVELFVAVGMTYFYHKR